MNIGGVTIQPIAFCPDPLKFMPSSQSSTLVIPPDSPPDQLPSGALSKPDGSWAAARLCSAGAPTARWGDPAPRPWHHASGSGAGVAYGLWGDSSFSLQDSTCSTVCSPRSPTGSVPARTIPSLLLPSVEMASGVHSLQHPSLLIQWLGPTLCSLLNRLLTFYSVDGLKLCHIFKFWLRLV